MARLCSKPCRAKNKTAWLYGLTIHQLKELGDACQICGLVGEFMHVDHDHQTGAVRGLLCSEHNTGLGKFGDSVEMLRRAIDYLN